MTKMKKGKRNFCKKGSKIQLIYAVCLNLSNRNRAFSACSSLVTPGAVIVTFPSDPNRSFRFINFSSYSDFFAIVEIAPNRSARFLRTSGVVLLLAVELTGAVTPKRTARASNLVDDGVESTVTDAFPPNFLARISNRSFADNSDILTAFLSGSDESFLSDNVDSVVSLGKTGVSMQTFRFNDIFFGGGADSGVDDFDESGDFKRSCVESKSDFSSFSKSS